MMKNQLQAYALSVVFLLVVALPIDSHAQGIDTDLSVTVGDVIILEAFSDISVTIPTAAMVTVLSDAGCAVNVEIVDCPLGIKIGTAVVVGSNLEVDLDVVTALDPLPTPTLTLQNVWSVRAIAAGGFQIEVKIDDGVLDLEDAGSGSKVTLSDLSVNPATFPPPGMGKPQAQLGDVTMTLDFSETTRAVAHTATGGSVYTISATFN